MKMLRRMRGATLLGPISNEARREEGNVVKLKRFLRRNGLKCYGYIQRREEDSLSKKMLDYETRGRRKRLHLHPNLRSKYNNESHKRVLRLDEMTSDRALRRLTIMASPRGSGQRR